MKTADKNYMDANDYSSLINSGGNAVSGILHQIKWDGKEPTVTNNYTTVNESTGTGTKTSTIIIVVAVLLVAVVGVVLFTRKS